MILCTYCFDEFCAGYRFYLHPQSLCGKCGRKCLGYEPTRMDVVSDNSSAQTQC